MESLCQCCRSLRQSNFNFPYVSRTIRTSAFTVFLVVSLCILHTDSVKDPPTFAPDKSSTKIFQDTADKKYYREFHLQLESSGMKLYVGAMNRLYRFDANNIENNQKSALLDVNENIIKDCERKKEKPNFNCQNHIRTILIKKDKITVCGTGAFKPVTTNLEKESLQVIEWGGSDSGLALCPYDPEDNATWVWVESGNPGGIPQVYSATVADAAKSDPLIYRPELGAASSLVRTLPQNPQWLNDAQFVGSFDVDQYVYFFFRETALEHATCGKATFARVARVCKSDLGGPTNSILEDVWTTFLKARLLCSVDGETPFYFNEIYDVVRDGDTFIGTFATNSKAGFYGSAVCSFTLSAINNAFEGSFKNPKDNWKPISNGEIPTPRPGTCQENSKNLPQQVLPFIKAFPMMDRPATHQLGMPLHMQQNVVFTRMVLHQAEGKDGRKFRVLFLAADTGEIYKVLFWKGFDQFGQDAYKSRLLGIIKPEIALPIWAMVNHENQIFAGTDLQVMQLSVHQCQAYSTCTQCVGDPYCGWDTSGNQCRPYQPGYLQDVHGERLEVCRDYCQKGPRTEVKVNMKGDTMVLKCESHCNVDGGVRWLHEGSDVLAGGSPRYLLTHDNRLVVVEVNNTDGGLYSCQTTGGIILSEHRVTVPGCTDEKCIWRTEFKTWCQEFDKYKREFNHWQCLKNKNCQGDNCDTEACPYDGQPGT